VLRGAPSVLPVRPLRRGPSSASLPSLQELVREMVDADVELMKNNPNA